MAQSLSKILVHIIFSTKNRQSLISKEIEKELYPYIGDVIKRVGGVPYLINGVSDHVHILSSLPKTITLSKYIEEIKRNSSRWIKTKGLEYKYFSWQNGYGVFSVSISKKDNVIKYIAGQKEHHAKCSFKEELIKFLKEYEIEYDENYLWS